MARIIASRLSRGPQVTPCNRTCRITARGSVIEALAPERTPISAIVPPGRTRRSEASSVSAPPTSTTRSTGPPASSRALRPVGFPAIVDDCVGAELGEPLRLGLARRRRHDPRAEPLGELQREQRDAAGPLRDDDRSRPDRALLDYRRPCGQRRAWQCGGGLGRDGRRQQRERLLRDRHCVAQDAVAGPAERAREFRVIGLARDPAGKDGNHDPVAGPHPRASRPDRLDGPRTVRAGDDRQGLAWAVDALDEQEIAPVQADPFDAHPRFPGTRLPARAPRCAGCRCRSRRSAPKPGQSCRSLPCALRPPPPADATTTAAFSEPLSLISAVRPDDAQPRYEHEHSPAQRGGVPLIGQRTQEPHRCRVIAALNCSRTVLKRPCHRNAEQARAREGRQQREL